MLLNYPLKVENLCNLHLDIHTIGYPEEGESLLTLLCDANRVLFTVLTDCYEEDGYNHVASLMQKLDICQIDAFIWTHPDKDHSVGIPKILSKYDPDKKAQIFLPQGVNKNMGIGQNAEEALDYIDDNYNSNTKYNATYVQLNKDEGQKQLMSLRIEVMNPRVTLYCRYNFLLPNDNKIHRLLNSDSEAYLNDLSLFYIVSFNDFNFIFCGDLSQQNVQFIDSNLLENSVFIKIPHHGSNNLKNFVPKFVSKGVTEAISTATVFKRHQLPKEPVLNEYAAISQGVYCTSDLKKQPIASFGCVTAEFYANMKKPKIYTTGNAYCFYPPNLLTQESPFPKQP